MLDEPEAPLPTPREKEVDVATAERDPGSQPLTNARHERFCVELAAGKSQAEAFRLAGYRDDPGNAWRLTLNDGVKARTSYLKRRTAQKLEITSDRIMQELALIGFARMADYGKLLETGRLDEITSEQSAAISELQITTNRDGTRRAKVKLAAKREALVDLGKATGLFDDRVDITVPVSFIIKRGENSVQIEAPSADEE